MKKNNMILWWSFWLLFLECLYKIFIIKNFFTLNTLSVIIFTIPWIVFFSAVTSLFNEKVNRLINFLLTGFIIVLTLAQIVYYNFYGSMFSFFSLTGGGTGQVFQFYTMIIEVILRIWYIFVLVLIPVVISIINRKKLKYERVSFKLLIVYTCILVVSFIGIFTICKTDKSLYGTKRLIKDTYSSMLTINKTGLMTMEGLDLYRFIFGFDEKLNIEEKNSSFDYNSKYNMLNIDFDSLIDKEEDEEVRLMHKYFKSIIPSEKNEYTSMFKNKNIILINAESFDVSAIDKAVTPTLYKMVNSSFVFNNYYQPLYPISTFDGEYMNLTSLIPKEGVWSLRVSSDKSMPFVYGKSFQKLGYNTHAFHNYVYNFYEREQTHPGMGFEYMACGNGLEKLMNCDEWPNSDYEMIKSTMDIYTKQSPFAIYYLTVSGHLNYNFRENAMSKKNKDSVSNLKLSNKMKAYTATNKELDKALEYLLKNLEEKGLLDDTLIVISPDHYPYGLTCNSLNENSKNDRCDKFELHHTSLIMYNPNIKKTEINKVVAGIDIMPTVYNLFGIEYDSRLLMGTDALSEKEGVVILSDRSWVSDYGTYDSITNNFTPFDGKKVDKDYVEKMNKIVNEKVSVSSLILDKNYYSKIGY